MSGWLELAESVLNAVWQGVALTASVWCLLRLLPRTNAATRYAIWMATLWAVAGLILFQAPPALTHDPPSALPRAAMPPQPEVEPEPAPSRTSGLRIALPAGRWPAYAFAAWALVVAVRLVRLAASYRHARRLQRDSQPAGPVLEDRLQHWIRVCGISRPVSLRVSEAIGTPVSVGLGVPAILLPSRQLERLAEGDIDRVVLHEMAHIRRYDDWTRLVQKLAEAVLFFHPAVLWVARRLDFEREVACDDWVVSVLQEPRGYASCLARLLEMRVEAETSPAALGAGLSRGQISRRIEMLLDQKRNAKPVISKTVLMAAVALVAAGLIVAAQGPVVRLVQASLQVSDQPAAQPSRSLEEEVRSLREKIRALEEENRRLLEERTRQIEPKLRDVEKQMARLKQQALRDIQPQIAQLQQEMERLQQEKLRELEPAIKRMTDEIRRQEEHKLRELEPQMRELEKRMQQLQEEKLRGVYEQLEELQRKALRELEAAKKKGASI